MLTSDIETNDNAHPPSTTLELSIPEEFGQLNESLLKCKAVDYGTPTNFHPVDSSEALLLIQGTREH